MPDEKLQIPVCFRISDEEFKQIDRWCGRACRKRSELVGLIVRRALKLAKRGGFTTRPVEDFIEHLDVNP